FGSVLSNCPVNDYILPGPVCHSSLYSSSLVTTIFVYISSVSSKLTSSHSPSNPANLLFGTNFFCLIIHSPPIVASCLQTFFLIVHFPLQSLLMYRHSVLVAFQVFEVLLLKGVRLNESFLPSRSQTIFHTQGHQFLHLLSLKYVLLP